LQHDVTRRIFLEPLVGDCGEGDVAASRSSAGVCCGALQAGLLEQSHEQVDLVFDLPCCRIQNVVDKEIAGRQAASRYLKQLGEIGVLKGVVVGLENSASIRNWCSC
jgi:hypothetical protein